jgi:hypothetical protein
MRGLVESDIMKLSVIKAAALSVLQFFLCLIGNHEWTCAAREGMPPTPAQLAGGMQGFRDYATMYCKHCHKVSDISER